MASFRTKGTSFPIVPLSRFVCGGYGRFIAHPPSKNTAAKNEITIVLVNMTPPSPIERIKWINGNFNDAVRYHYIHLCAMLSTPLSTMVFILVILANDDVLYF